MSTHENATPIRIMHNTAGHLAGSARSLGGVILGYLGVRTFYPRPVLKLIDNIGGCSVLLGKYIFNILFQFFVRILIHTLLLAFIAL